MSSEKIVEFVPLLNHKDYEILNEYPFTIRRKDNHYEIKESNDGHGYIRVHLNSVDYKKHRLIAQQFLPNDDPEHKNQIDHINRDKTDYHLENLRWCTQSENNKNKSSHNGIEYSYVDDISDDAIVVKDYGRYKLENYYFDEATDKFYFYNGVKYRELKNIEHKQNKLLYVNMVDIDNKRVRVYIEKFKRLYDLI